MLPYFHRTEACGELLKIYKTKQNRKKEVSVEARMQKYCGKSLASSSSCLCCCCFFFIRVPYHADKFKENCFFPYFFIVRTILKMKARDQTLLVLDSEIDHKQL